MTAVKMNEKLYTVSQIKRGHFSFRHNFYSC